MNHKPIVALLSRDKMFFKGLVYILRRFGCILQKNEGQSPDLLLVDMQESQGQDVSFRFEVREFHKRYGPRIPVLILSDKVERIKDSNLMIEVTDLLDRSIDKRGLITKLYKYIPTNEMEDFIAAFDASALTPGTIRIQLALEVQEVLEKGMKIILKHWIPIGSAIQVDGSIFNGWSHEQRPLFLTVRSIEKEKGRDGYRIFAEFENQTGEFLTRIRRWIVRNYLKTG